jgi:hypothetical protein
MASLTMSSQGQYLYPSPTFTPAPPTLSMGVTTSGAWLICYTASRRRTSASHHLWLACYPSLPLRSRYWVQKQIYVYQIC